MLLQLFLIVIKSVYKNMNQKINFKAPDENKEKESLKTLQDNIHIITDEVLAVIKELHKKHGKEINNKLIADRMIERGSISKFMSDQGHRDTIDESELTHLKKTVDTVLDKLSDLVSPSINDNYIEMKTLLKERDYPEGFISWMNSVIGIIKKYVNSISEENDDLKVFLQNVRAYLSEMDSHLAIELSSHDEKFQEDRGFEKIISSNMSNIEQSFDIYGDMKSIKKAVMDEITNISRNMEKKREQDILRLRETKKAVEEMNKKMSGIKDEVEKMIERSEQLESESLLDGLTGIYNRKAYDRKMEEMLADLHRYNHPASLLFFDIDKFKKINDCFGHHTGDLVIKKIAHILKPKLRENDFIARYGGDEFAIILSHTLLEEAIIITEKIRSYIGESNFSYKNKKIHITISAGISTFKRGDDTNTVFQRADNALHLAKKIGGNTIRNEDDIVINEGALN